MNSLDHQQNYELIFLFIINVRPKNIMNYKVLNKNMLLQLIITALSLSKTIFYLLYIGFGFIIYLKVIFHHLCLVNYLNSIDLFYFRIWER